MNKCLSLCPETSCDREWIGNQGSFVGACRHENWLNLSTKNMKTSPWIPTVGAIYFLVLLWTTYCAWETRNSTKSLGWRVIEQMGRNIQNENNMLYVGLKWRKIYTHDFFLWCFYLFGSFFVYVCVCLNACVFVCMFVQGCLYACVFCVFQWGMVMRVC